jgi:diguanylate cyclase (GGDEF)-like protein
MQADSWPAKETLRLSKLKSYNILDTIPETAYDDIATLAAHICQTPTALISLIDGERQWFKAKVGLQADETSRKVAFCHHTIQHSGILIVEDAQQDPRFSHNPLVTGYPHIRFYAGAPLVTPDGYSLGSLCVIDYQPRKLTDSQLQGLQALSRQVVAQMELGLRATQLKAFNENLEHRVNERTVGLTSALNRLLKTQNKLLKREAALRHSSLHDPLTGLPNRSYFSQRLDQAIQLASRQPEHLYAVLFIDLDNFKPVNDTLGHDVGDRLLQHVASQIKLLLRKSDLVARLGGDEFAVLLDDIPNEEHAIVVVQRLQARIKHPFTVGTQQIFMGASVGITFSSRGYRQPEAAIRDADVAMYQAKRQAKQQAEERLQAQLKQSKQPAQPEARSHKSPIFIQDERSPAEQHFVVFNAATQNVDKAKRSLQKELHQALLNDEFRLYYQPIFQLSAADPLIESSSSLLSASQPDSPSGPLSDSQLTQLVGFEVLLRWHHPERGCLQAEEFVEIAEEIGIMRQLCQQTIRTACQQLKAWRSHPNCHELSIHLNVSLLQIMDSALLPQWQAELNRCQLPPSACQLEIEEQVLLSSDPMVMTALQNIKDLGMGLCVDDFGRGHSSLSRLHQLNVSALKIDRAFIEELTSADGVDIVKTIIDLGRSANMAVIAEGVETPAQLETLIQLGCPFAQGFCWRSRSARW